MRRYDSWVVAAAVLAESDWKLHYKVLAERVVDSGLSTLGLKGGTPAQTLGALLRNKYTIFEADGQRSGYYGLCSRSEVLEHPEVRQVISLLRTSGS